MSAAQVCDVCIHCLGPERMSYDLWAGDALAHRGQAGEGGRDGGEEREHFFGERCADGVS